MWENQKLADHRSGIFDRNNDHRISPFCRHKHRFKKHAKFTLTESITNTNKPNETLQEILKVQENFWIRTLEILQQQQQQRSRIKS